MEKSPSVVRIGSFARRRALCHLPVPCSLLYLCSCVLSHNCPDRVVKTTSVTCVSLRCSSLCGPFSLCRGGLLDVRLGFIQWCTGVSVCVLTAGSS